MPNLIEHWGRLTSTDKECILKACRKWPRYQRVSPGTLPMLDLGCVMMALTEYKDDLQAKHVTPTGSHPDWVKHELALVAAVASKLPAELPDEKRVVWLQGG